MARSINRQQTHSPVIVTTISMAIGSVLLLGFGWLVEGINLPTPSVLLAVLWLAVINTALAFTLWNLAMQHLEAFEASIIQNTMLPQITLLAILFLDESPTIPEWIGLVIIVISVGFVQYLGLGNNAKSN